MPEAQSSCGERNASAATTTRSAGTKDVSRVRRSSTVTPVTRRAVVLHPPHQRQVVQLEPLGERVPRLDQRAEHDVRAGPAHRPVRLRIAGDRQGARTEAVGQLGAELLLEQRSDRPADTGVGERGVLHVQQPSGLVDERLPFRRRG